MFLISGNGKTSVEAFQGYAGFVDHISKGKFSKTQPGSPIFCTFNYVKDNSPFKAVFKYSIKKEPLYVEMVRENFDKGASDLYFNIRLNFYRDTNRRPIIASPKIKFKFKIQEKISENYMDDFDKIPYQITDKEFMNSSENTSLLTLTNLTDWQDHSDGIGDTFWLWRHELIVTLEDSYGYKVIGGRTATTCKAINK